MLGGRSANRDTVLVRLIRRITGHTTSDRRFRGRILQLAKTRLFWRPAVHIRLE